MNINQVIGTAKRCCVVALLGAFLMHQGIADSATVNIDALSVLASNILIEAKANAELRQHISIATNAIDLSSRSEKDMIDLAGAMPRTIKENIRNSLTAKDRRMLIVKSLHEFFYMTPKNEMFRLPFYVETMKLLCTPCNNAEIKAFCQAHQAFLAELQKYVATGGSVWTFSSKLQAAHDSIKDPATKAQIKVVTEQAVKEFGKLGLMRVVSKRLSK